MTSGIGIVVCLVLFVVGLLLARTVRPTKIDDTHVWLRCGRAFVDSLPPAPSRW